MGRKPRRNKSARKPPKVINGPTAKENLARAKLGRVEEDILHRQLLERHGYDVPVRDTFTLRAIRLEGVISG